MAPSVRSWQVDWFSFFTYPATATTNSSLPYIALCTHYWLRLAYPNNDQHLQRLDAYSQQLWNAQDRDVMGISLYSKDLCCQLFGRLFISGNDVDKTSGWMTMTHKCILVLHCMDLHPFWRSRATLLDRAQCQPQPSKGRLSTTTWTTGVLCCHWSNHRLCYWDDPSLRYEACDAQGRKGAT